MENKRNQFKLITATEYIQVNISIKIFLYIFFFCCVIANRNQNIQLGKINKILIINSQSET